MRSTKMNVLTRLPSERRCADSCSVCSKTQSTRLGAISLRRSICSMGRSGESVVVDDTTNSRSVARALVCLPATLLEFFGCDLLQVLTDNAHVPNDAPEVSARITDTGAIVVPGGPKWALEHGSRTSQETDQGGHMRENLTRQHLQRKALTDGGRSAILRGRGSLYQNGRKDGSEQALTRSAALRSSCSVEFVKSIRAVCSAASKPLGSRYEDRGTKYARTLRRLISSRCMASLICSKTRPFRSC